MPKSALRGYIKEDEATDEVYLCFCVQGQCLESVTCSRATRAFCHSTYLLLASEKEVQAAGFRPFTEEEQAQLELAVAPGKE